MKEIYPNIHATGYRNKFLGELNKDPPRKIIEKFDRVRK